MFAGQYYKKAIIDCKYFNVFFENIEIIQYITLLFNYFLIKIPNERQTQFR